MSTIPLFLASGNKRPIQNLVSTSPVVYTTLGRIERDSQK